jgi:hypothetical protein
MFERSSHSTRVWNLWKLYMCALPQGVSSGENAAVHSRTASERSQPTRFVISVYTYTRTHTESRCFFFRFLSCTPRQRQNESKARLSLGFSVDNITKRTKPHSNTDNNTLAAIHRPGSSLENPIAWDTSDVQVDLLFMKDANDNGTLKCHDAQQVNTRASNRTPASIDSTIFLVIHDSEI